MSFRATGSSRAVSPESSELSSAASSSSESEAASTTSTLATAQSQHAAGPSKAPSQPVNPLPRRSKRKSGVVEDSAAASTPSTSAAVGSSKKRKRQSAAATQLKDQTQEIPQAAPRRSRRSLGTSAQTFNSTQPSTKALGKRRAVSPAPEAQVEQNNTSRPSKRRKTEPSESRSYNLRTRPTDTKPAKKSKAMVRKGKSSSGANSPAKVKAEMDEASTSAAFIDDLPPSGGRANKRRARTSAAAASPAKDTASTLKPRTAKSTAADFDACETSAAVSRPASNPDGSVRMEVDEPILDGALELDMEEGVDMAQLIDAFEDEEDDMIGQSEDEEIAYREEPALDLEGMDEQADLDEQDQDDPEEREYDDEGLPVNNSGGASNPSANARAALDDTFNLYGGMGGFASMMSGFTSRLRSILTNLKDRSPEADPSLKLMSLQDLSEILSISTEDTLTGMISIDAFCKELVHILRGEDPLLMLNGEENLMEMMLLACRCLANLMEALPGSSHSVVANGAVPVLCAKLLEIQYIDLAEQTLSTLEKISLEMPGSVVREGGLTALLTYLDFFSTHVQRTAVTAAANCCRSLSVDSFPMVQSITPILQNVLSYSDQRVVEQACMALTRIVDSYRHHPDKLEALLTADLLGPIEKLLIPGNASPIGSTTYTQVLRMLGIAAKASPEVSIALIEMNIANTLYLLLGGLSPPAPGEEITGVKKHREENDMYVLQNLVHRPKEQVQEALALVGELLPALPRDGIFSSKPNASRSGRKVKKVKRETASPTRAPEDQESAVADGDTPSQANLDNSASADNTTTFALEVDDEEDVQEVKLEDRSDDMPSELQNTSAVSKEKPNDRRIAHLHSEDAEHASLVKRYFALMLPMLVEVYSASVGVPSKSKAITGICKVVFYCPKEDLQAIISGLPIAGFLGSVLASRDQSSLLINALQLVELFLVKLPELSHYQFRREGVLHGIQELADTQLLVPQAKKNKPTANQEQPDTAAVTTLDSASAAENAEIAALARILRQNERTAAALVSADDHMKDLITLRAKFVRDRYCSTSVASASQAVEDLEQIKGLVAGLQELSNSADSDIVPAVEKNLDSIVNLFSDPEQPLSSFEMTESGLVTALLHFSMANETSPLSTFSRQELLAKAFGISPARNDSNAYSVIVSRLQNSMSKMEEFDVVTALQGSVERNSASMLARQLKLKLVSEDEGVPRSCNNVIVSIHAIATFQAFNDYLRPRIAAAATAAAGGSSSRLSGALAAFASAGGLGELSGLASSPAQPSEASTSTAAQEGSSTVSGDKSLRRRSSRLSAKEGKESQPSSSQPPTPQEVETPIDDQAASTAQDDESAPVSVAPSADGSRLEGHTPGGTRVATPAFGKAAGAGSSQPALTRAKGSYAAALKTEPTDFHLKFYMGDVEIAHDTTVYGAVHQHELRQSSATSRTMWSNIYTVRFKKFSGPAPLDATRSSPDLRSREGSSPLESLPTSIVPGSRQAEVLQLLRVFHLLNSDLQDVLSTEASTSRLPTTAFVNNKLTAKLNRQLEEPMIVASSCLPEWALELPQSFSFLFPFETRFSLLQSTSFGYARLMQKWLGQARSETRRDESLSFLGRLQRQKVRIARDRLLESAFKVFELYGQSRAMLEIEFFDEVGTGLGPTLEFYALVSKEFSLKNLGLWRNSDDAANPSLYVDNPCGLFPAPIANADAVTGSGRKITTMFRFLGQFIAKSLMDSRIIDLPFSRTFMKLLLDRQLPIACSSVKAIDPVLGKSLDQLEAYVLAREEIKSDTSKTDDEKADALSNIRVKDASISDLSLDFTLPGYSSIRLKSAGDQMDVTIDNVDEYISLVIEYTLVNGVSSQVQAFRDGFSEIFPVKDLACFSAEELVMLFGNNVEDWSVETLSDSLRADHGFSMESKVVKDFVGMLAAFEDSERRAFLSFATGSPRLPVGGFRALHPSLTIVRKLPEPGHHADEYLPSVMTCQNYVKMPEYSSSTVLKDRLTVAVQEGQGAFHLS